MKKILLIIFFSNISFSELILEITQGTEDPFRVAIIEFQGSNEISKDVHEIIKNNLKRSGEFTIFDNDDLLSTPKSENDIIFNDFKILNIDYLVI